MKKFTYKNKSFSTQKELFSFLCENEKAIITQKKSISFTDALAFKTSFAENTIDKIEAVKNRLKVDGEEITDNKDIDIVNVIVIGNTMNWLDSQDDVLINDCFKKSLQESQGKFKHLCDHNQKTTGKIGIPNKVYLEDRQIRDLGFNQDGNTQVLTMDSNVLKCYNENLFYQYLNNDIDQHSVGMIYVKLILCINDSENEEKFKNWNTYFSSIINKEEATANGYFFAVTEAKLLEVSAVLFGANSLTPTISTNPIVEPSNDTQKQSEPPIEGTQIIPEPPVQKKKLFIN